MAPKNVGEVIAELGTVYRDARSKKLDTLDASRLASILTLLRQAIEGRDLEDRLAEVEAELKRLERR